jgi:16S rRNA (uracil1498-N3)-methyltransferase
VQRITIDPDRIQGDRLTLDRSQERYLTKVIRLKVGDRFQAIDGRGKLYLAQLDLDGAIVLEVTEILTPDLPFEITLILAVPKGNGFDDTIRMCAELGATKILPVTTDRTQLTPNQNKIARWQKIAEEAAEQSERSRITVIHESIPVMDVFNGSIFGDDKYICEARGKLPHLLDCLPAQQPAQKTNSPHHFTVAIGPEGGWSDRELQTASNNQFQPVSIGSTILRAITAPIVVMSLLTGFYRS